MKKLCCMLLVVVLSLGTVMCFAAETVLTPSAVAYQSDGTVNVQAGSIKNWGVDSYVGWKDVDFTDAKSVRISAQLSYSVGDNGEAFALYLDDPLKGMCIGYIVVCDLQSEPKTYGVNLTEAVSGKHNLYLKQNYSHTNYLTVYSLTVSPETWRAPDAVTPVPDSAIIDTYADTWTAVDAVGRKLADYEETGAVKPGTHDTIMFYHDWHIHQAEAYIASEIIAEYPEAKDDFYHKAWPSYGPAWWDEPVYGFYDDMDYWHYRKAAELMTDAGVDAVVLDYTNGDSAYARAFDVMLHAYHDAREAGVDVPKVSGYLQMGSTYENRLNLLKAMYFIEFYSGDYADLWYYVDGKPLMIQNGYDEVAKAVTKNDNEELYLAEDLIDYFTFRQTGDREKGTDKNGYWHWLVNYPQHAWGKTADGRVECVNLGMAINHSYLYNYAGVGVFSEEFTKGKAYTEAFGEDYRPEAVHEGYFFREQASRVLDLDPAYVLIDGWNEYNTARSHDYYGAENAFIDMFDDNKSRDFEPTKGVVKDDYYNLLVDFIRKYKGVRPAPVASAEKTIDIYAGEAAWQDVLPEFINYDGSYERDADGYKKYGTTEFYHYTTEVNNAILRSKVSRDAENLYFHAVCVGDVALKDSASMNLYINADRNYATGWEGYDYLVKGNTVYRFADGAYQLTEAGSAESAATGKGYTVKVPRAVLGVTGTVDLEFKWTDNVTPDGELLLFYTEGNTAPVGRFNYLYTEIAQTALTDAQRAALKDMTVVKAGAQKMIVNGAKMNVYDKDLRIRAYEANGTIYLPMSAVEELLGYGESKVTYDYKKNMVYIKTHDLENMEITNYQWLYTVLGTNEVRIGGKYATTTNPVTAVNGMIYIPATVLSECFGWTVLPLSDGAYILGKFGVDEATAQAVLSHLQ